MFSFKRRSIAQKSTTGRALIESLESRALLSATPATLDVTVPGSSLSSVIAGATVNDKISVNLANNDVVKARGRNSITLFLSTDNTLSNDDHQIQSPTTVGLNINPGKNHTFQIRVKSFAKNLSGSFVILAEVSGSGVNPTVGSSVATFAVEQSVIDLANLGIKAPLNGRAGRHIPVSVLVTNEGNTLAKGPLAVDFALSNSGDGSSAVALTPLTKRISLKPGKSTTLHFSVLLGLGVAPTGNEHFVVTIDPANAFLDPLLGNNILVDQQPIQIT